MSKLINEEEKLANGTLWEVRALLAQGVEVNTCSEDNQLTALHIAVRKGCIGNVSYLLRSGANVNARSSTGDTPLHYAAEYGNVNMVWLLVACNAEIDAQNNNGQTPLHVSLHCKDVIKALLQVGADRTLRNNSGQTPCDIAKKNQHHSECYKYAKDLLE